MFFFSDTKDSFSPKSKIPSMFTRSPRSKNKKEENVLTLDEKEAIDSDTLNTKLWGECLRICEKQGKKVIQVFFSYFQNSKCGCMFIYIFFVTFLFYKCCLCSE